MYKKLRKFCAWALAVATVVSLVPSSGLVMADETDTSVNAEVEQGTVYFKIPDAGGQVFVTTDKYTENENTQIITVTDEKTTLADKDGNETDVTLTEEGYSLEITGDVESVVDVEILPAEGYEVGTYHILSDTGDVVDEPEISSENKYEVTISKDIQVVEVLFNAVETQSETTEEQDFEEGEELETTEAPIDAADMIENGNSHVTAVGESKPGIDMRSYVMLATTRSSGIPSVGSQVTGSCYIGDTWNVNYPYQDYFYVSDFSGDLAGAVTVQNFECLDPTAALPSHTWASYVATVTEVNMSGGYVEYYVRVTPPGATDGVTTDGSGHLTGYQHVGGKVRVPRAFTGSGYIVKMSSNTSLTSGNSNYNLTGATYNIYKTRSDAQNNINAISGKQFKIASNSGTSNTVELDPGTYYIKEVNGSDGTGYTTSSTIYTITITAGQYGKNLTPSGGIKNTPKTVTIDLYKTPSNPICVENNENYSLEGAVYGIYTNSACTALKTKATTNEDGEFSVTGLPLGQYWVKEITASPGYNVDPNIYAVDARKEGSEAVRVFTVESHEVPIMDPGDLILKKVDSNTNGTMEDQGTMEGAEFIAKFYGVAVEDIADGTDPATLGYQPTRTWRLKTTEVLPGQYGIDLYLGNAIKVSGDEFYYAENGDVSLPFGILTFQEVKSPNGYLINDEIIVQEISDKNGGNDTAIVEHVSTQKEDSLTLRLVKTQYDTDEVIPGVTYRWTRPDGTVNTYTTDADGVVEFHGLTWGKHTIEEIDVPDGYAVNTNRIEFTVAQDNTITFDKEYPMSDTNGVITVSLDTEGNMDVDYTNKPAPFDLKIHKVNNHNFPLEGAEFTLYSDEKCTQVVDVQVTDSDGELTFADLIPYKEYWMKETDAPPGYRIPVNDDGSDIIWKIDVESVPVNDEFTFNVNDTAYTVHSTGSIWIDGTKADRVCNITVVNEVGMKLPNTGSSMMILLLIAGVMLMGSAIVISRKSRKTSDDKE